MSQRAFNNLIINYQTASITAFADAGGGKVNVTTSDYYFKDNATITITGTTNYNGTYTATPISNTVFQITATWVSDDATGTWVGGVTITAGNFVTGHGKIDSIGYDVNYTSLNQCIRNVRLDLLKNASFELNGDWTSLETDDRITDNHNFGGNHKFYFDSTEIEEFDGLITAIYKPDDRITEVTITGEGHAA